MRCDHCHGRLGLVVHRRWSMRFCSPKCRNAYRLRCNEEAIERITSLILATAKTIQVAAQVLLPRPTSMKQTALLTLVLLTVSYPLMAKTSHAHHDAARDSHSHITCETVRAYVAQVGLEQATEIAQANGMTASEKERAKQCLAN